MKIFKRSKMGKIIYLLTLLLVLSSCNQLSQGLQRRKFEFLYKLNNYATIFADYTNGIYYFNELNFYERRMKKLYEDINRVEPVEGYGYSRVLKENFLTTIDGNINTALSLKQKSLQPTDNIRKEYDVIIMNEKVDNFINMLNDEISKVGKE
jgi:hypothetical protein